jgi:hypothetical protein
MKIKLHNLRKVKLGAKRPRKFARMPQLAKHHRRARRKRAPLLAKKFVNYDRAWKHAIPLVNDWDT